MRRYNIRNAAHNFYHNVPVDKLEKRKVRSLLASKTSVSFKSFFVNCESVIEQKISTILKFFQEMG